MKNEKETKKTKSQVLIKKGPGCNEKMWGWCSLRVLMHDHPSGDTSEQHCVDASLQSASLKRRNESTIGRSILKDRVCYVEVLGVHIQQQASTKKGTG